jgi:hypothetical protein
MRLGRLLQGFSVLIVAMSTMVISGPIPHAAAARVVDPGLAAQSLAQGDSPLRTCENFYTGDGSRRLSVCASYWLDAVDPSFGYHRALVEMHTYVGTRAGWVDSRSQSITLNLATWNPGGASVTWGTNGGTTTSRINSPSGAIGCGATNTVRVAFYSAVRNFSPIGAHNNTVWQASWRDDRGVAHYVTEDRYSYPDTMPIVYNY